MTQVNSAVQDGVNNLFRTLRNYKVSLLKIIITNTNIWLLKKTKGRFGNSFLGMSVMLLTSTGAKSGLVRVTPLFYVVDNEKIIVVGSNGGGIKNPAWVKNITANPTAKVTIKGQEKAMQAHTASTDEYQRYWPVVTEMFPIWQKFQDKNLRQFPVIVFEPS
jgi:F420H(2)-dependent quinone reductase